MEELEADASEADDLERINDLRLAILSAVSHDLRTPLAGIKASVTSLLDDEIDWPPAEREAFLETIDAEADRLDALVGNLLDMSRLQTGALNVSAAPDRARRGRPGGAAEHRDAGRRDRRGRRRDAPARRRRRRPPRACIANVVANALVHGDGAPVRIVAGAVNGGVDLRVVDRGPGVPTGERERVFVPFQRLGDSPQGGSVGLGLAVARGFVEAMGGSVELEDTPGGGLTVILRLQAAA